MKIALIAESYPPAVGGAEFALQKLVEGFVQRGHEVWVVTSSWQRHAAGEEQTGSLRISRVKTPPFFHRFWFILFSFSTALRAARWAEIVEGTTFAGGPPAFLASWIARRKKVLLAFEVWGRRWREYEPSALRRSFYRAMEWIVVRLPFDSYIAISEYTKRCLQESGVEEEMISVVYLGDARIEMPTKTQEELRRELGFEKDDFVYFSFGRVGISKGFEFMAKAIPEITANIPRARFVLVLSGYDRRIMRTVRQSLASMSEHRCRLLTSLPRNELAKYFWIADCYVIPSLSEGFGFSALEASNGGKVVVSTDAGSLPEVVFGRHLFVRPRSIEDLIAGCERAFRGLVNDEPRREFSWEKTVGNHLLIYQELIRSKES